MWKATILNVPTCQLVMNHKTEAPELIRLSTLLRQEERVHTA
jgi:hypothetical protein